MKKSAPRVNTIKALSDTNVSVRDLADIVMERLMHAPGVRPKSYWRRRKDNVPAYVEAIDTKHDRVIYRRSENDEEEALMLSRKVFLRDYAPVPS